MTTDSFHSGNEMNPGGWGAKCKSGNGIRIAVRMEDGNAKVKVVSLRSPFHRDNEMEMILPPPPWQRDPRPEATLGGTGGPGVRKVRGAA